MEPHPLNAVIAFVRPSRLEALVHALRALPDFPGVSITDVRGMGSDGACSPPLQGSDKAAPFTATVRLEIFCRGSDVSAIIHTIQRTAQTDAPGDGKVFVLDVAWAVRIHTDEIGDAALRSTG